MMHWYAVIKYHPIRIIIQSDHFRAAEWEAGSRGTNTRAIDDREIPSAGLLGVGFEGRLRRSYGPAMQTAMQTTAIFQQH